MKNNIPFFGFMLAIIASMAFIAGGGITNALAQNATVTRDSLTLLLEGKTLSGKAFLHIYDTTPYLIGKGHIAMHVPCDASSKPLVNILVGKYPNLQPIQPELLKELSQPGKVCTYHIDVGSDIAKKILADDILIQNPTDKPISFPSDSGITIGVDEIMPGGEEP